MAWYQKHGTRFLGKGEMHETRLFVSTHEVLELLKASSGDFIYVTVHGKLARGFKSQLPENLVHYSLANLGLSERVSIDTTHAEAFATFVAMHLNNALGYVASASQTVSLKGAAYNNAFWFSRRYPASKEEAIRRIVGGLEIVHLSPDLKDLVDYVKAILLLGGYVFLDSACPPEAFMVEGAYAL